MLIALISVSVALALVIGIGIIAIRTYNKEWKKLVKENDRLTNRTNPHFEDMMRLRRDLEHTRDMNNRFNAMYNNIEDETNAKQILGKIFWLHANGKPLKDMEMLIKNWKKTVVVNEPYNGQVRFEPMRFNTLINHVVFEE